MPISMTCRVMAIGFPFASKECIRRQMNLVGGAKFISISHQISLKVIALYGFSVHLLPTLLNTTQPNISRQAISMTLQYLKGPNCFLNILLSFMVAPISKMQQSTSPNRRTSLATTQAAACQLRSSAGFPRRGSALRCYLRVDLVVALACSWLHPVQSGYIVKGFVVANFLKPIGHWLIVARQVLRLALRHNHRNRRGLLGINASNVCW